MSRIHFVKLCGFSQLDFLTWISEKVRKKLIGFSHIRLGCQVLDNRLYRMRGFSSQGSLHTLAGDEQMTYNLDISQNASTNWSIYILKW